MGAFQSIRGAPRLCELDFGALCLDLPFDLDEDPDTLQPNLLLQRSQNGNVETMPRQGHALLHLRMPDMDEPTLRRWKLLFDRSLQRGRRIEFARDSGRCFWLAGDTARDLQAGLLPIAGSDYSLVTQGGTQGQGAVSVDLADPASNTRTNLVPNGDALDAATGWTNDTPTLLSMTPSTFVAPNGDVAGLFEFVYIGSGTKTAHIDFEMAGLTASTFTADLAYFSFLVRSDRSFSAGLGNVLTLSIMPVNAGTPATAQAVTIYAGTPPAEWTRFGVQLDTSGFTGSSTTLRLQADFPNDLRIAPVYLTELQLEARRFGTAFIPYSTTRGLTGSRAAAQVLRYLNRLGYFHQAPTIKAGGRWGFTVAFRVTPHFDSAGISAATLSFYQDGDAVDVDTIGALSITATATTGVVTATAALDDLTSVTATPYDLGSWAAYVGRHIAVSFLDWDGATASSGKIDLWVDGVKVATVSHSRWGARQGKFFWLGSTPTGTQNASSQFSDVAQDARYIDGTTVLIGEYYYTAADVPLRPDRNSYRAVLDPGQKGRSDRSVDNTTPLDVMLAEVVT